MYKKGLTALAIENENILKEHNGIVYMKFGTEYTIRLENTNNSDAIIGIKVDGNDVLDGASLIISPNNTVDILGFIGSKQNSTDNRLKFIRKEESIKDDCCDNSEDGIIEIEFYFDDPDKDHINSTHDNVFKMAFVIKGYESINDITTMSTTTS